MRIKLIRKYRIFRLLTLDPPPPLPPTLRLLLQNARSTKCYLFVSCLLKWTLIHQSTSHRTIVLFPSFPIHFLSFDSFYQLRVLVRRFPFCLGVDVPLCWGRGGGEQEEGRIRTMEQAGRRGNPADRPGGGSVTFWYGSGSADPCLCLMDPAPD